jgi:hypothetical protein
MKRQQGARHPSFRGLGLFDLADVGVFAFSRRRLRILVILDLALLVDLVFRFPMGELAARRFLCTPLFAV